MKFKEVLYSDLKLGTKYVIMHTLQYKNEKKKDLIEFILEYLMVIVINIHFVKFHIGVRPI